LFWFIWSEFVAKLFFSFGSGISSCIDPLNKPIRKNSNLKMKQEEAEIVEKLTLTAKYSGKQIEITINSDESYLDLKLKLQQGFKFYFLNSKKQIFFQRDKRLWG
jgi:hypothetical protein